VKAGRFFTIPERPRDLNVLWKRGITPALNNLPEWLSPDDASYYRLVECVRTPDTLSAEDEAFRAEVDEMELARLIVDGDPKEPYKHRVYMACPQPEAVFSIGIYQGRSPLRLRPADVPQPVLTAEDVTDVTASFVADPFWIRRDGRWYMFFEVMNWKANKGEIGLATSDDGLHWRYEQIVLAEEFHLSYPYVFAATDGIYMVPESFQDESVLLYRARRFPHEWEFVGKLLSGGYYADSSLFHYRDIWWLMTETSQEANDTLRLFVADQLQGPWHEHPQSPVVSGNSQLSRPAGRVLVRGEVIFRFAQDCTVDYGAAVRPVKIARLSRSEYFEVQSRRRPLGPSGSGWNASGMHHVDAIQLGVGNWLAAVDGWHWLAAEGDV
jgi:hypothetical protein